ncbi:unnamed protein product, partial [Closterium sp. NIES-53]
LKPPPPPRAESTTHGPPGARESADGPGHRQCLHDHHHRCHLLDHPNLCRRRVLRHPLCYSHNRLESANDLIQLGSGAS